VSDETGPAHSPAGSDEPYTGDVVVGGPAQTLELETLSVTKVAVGGMANNAYLLRCRETGSAVLVDAAAEAETLLALVGALAHGSLPAVVTTHRHPDHWGALAQVVLATGATTYAGAPDVEGIPVGTDVALHHGDEVPVGRAALRVVALPGHTPGSIGLVLEGASPAPVVLTGDALFPGGIGRTTSPAAFTSAYDAAVRELFDPLPDETRVLPGHGRDTTLGAERPSLGEWRARGW
jgi:glyoxylase-like metal-dependent hydrolase (beta-lactamase superfamily II)